MLPPPLPVNSGIVRHVVTTDIRVGMRLGLLKIRNRHCENSGPSRCSFHSAPAGYDQFMATQWKCPRPESGPESHDAITRSLLAGFVAPGAVLAFGHEKVVAGILQARIFAVGVALELGLSAPLHALVERLGVSDRWLQNHFPVKTALYAFPPPELAESLGAAGAAATSWAEVGPLIRPVFLALDDNPQGRSLLSGLCC